MLITKIWVSQRGLKRAGQVPAMIETLLDGGLLPPITLDLCDDDEIQVHDGHHRLTAIFLSGQTELRPEQFVLYYKDGGRQRFGRLEDLVERAYGG